MANFVLKSTKVIEDKSDSIGNIMEDVVEKGKDFIEDLRTKDVDIVEETEPVKDKKKVEEKRARERLKDKGLL